MLTQIKRLISGRLPHRQQVAGRLGEVHAAQRRGVGGRHAVGQHAVDHQRGVAQAVHLLAVFYRRYDQGASREEGLRVVPLFNELGYHVLIIKYRNDVGEGLSCPGTS